ncbi:MAG: hypothetical protein ACREDV_09015 [Methylocella sp.]
MNDYVSCFYMGEILAEDPVDLDRRRGAAAQKLVNMRRQRAAADARHGELRVRQMDLEDLLLAAPSSGWVDAVTKARYLLVLLAQTPAAEDLRRAKLIADVFDDFERLLAETKSPPSAGDPGLAPASFMQKRIAMAKGQLRSNREAKKPKKEKPKAAAATQASFGFNPQKTAAANDDRIKKK